MLETIPQFDKTHYWQGKKNDFVSELSRLLKQGVSQDFGLEQTNPILTKEKLNQLTLSIESNIETPQIEQIAQELVQLYCFWQIQGKNGLEYDIIRLSMLIKSEIEANVGDFSYFKQKDLDYYRDIISQNAEKKNYSYKFTRDIQNLVQKFQQTEQIQIGLHDIWEIKDIQLLKNNGDIEQIEYTHKMNRYHQILLKNLERLIKAIEKGKEEDDCYGLYCRALANKPKKKQTVIREKVNIQEDNLDLVQKKVKIAPIEKNQAAVRIKNNAKNEQMVQEEEIVNKENAKKIGKDNQKSLLKFFNKQPQQASVPEKKICKYNDDFRVQSSEQMNLTQEKDKIMSIVKENSKKQWHLLSKSTPKKRKIFIIIHDYIKAFKNVFFKQKSNIINGRNILAKDQQIQYDLETEDELQELNAENIENEDQIDIEDDEEIDEEDPSEQKFIVSDGYLSNEGLESDNLDDQKQSLNFVKYNYSGQSFLRTERDLTSETNGYLSTYQMKIYQNNEEFPLKLKSNEEVDQAVCQWNGEKIKQIIWIIEGSNLSKKLLIEEIQKTENLKEISKYSIEKKIKQIAFKDKKWKVHQQIIESLNFKQDELFLLKSQFVQDVLQVKVSRNNQENENINRLEQNCSGNKTQKQAKQQTLFSYFKK